jgi:hypothetical protein
VKTQKQLKTIHPNNIGMPIISVLDFNRLTDLQKDISVTMFTLNRLNIPNFVFSIEDVFQTISRNELLERDAFDSTKFLAAHFIPFNILQN